MRLNRIHRAGLVLAFVGGLFAQNPAIKRTVLQQKDLSIPGREVVLARVDITPGMFAGRHTHAGEEISYILSGEGEILIEGQPPLIVKAGDSFVVPAGARHDAHNTGTEPLKMLASYVVEKGKPLATPAP